MKQLLLIDGDELAYKIGFVTQTVEYSVYHGDTLLFSTPHKADAIERVGDTQDQSLEMRRTIISHPADSVIDGINSILNPILEALEHNDYKIYFTGDHNFRIGRATLLPYKGNRTSTERPLHFEFIKYLLQNDYGAITVNGIEADDALSIMQWQTLLSESQWETTIVSQDKDLSMVPGWHYNPTKRIRFHQDVDSSKLCFYKQILTGDSTDNIPGIYRVGEKTAETILSPYKSSDENTLFNVVINQYLKAEQTPKVRDKMPGDLPVRERVLEVACLLWMLQERGQIWCPEEVYYQNIKC